MGQAQIGNKLGLTAVGVDRQPGIEITADGANTVTIAAADLQKLPVGSVIDLYNKTTGAVLASARTVTNATSAGVITYDGADATAVVGTHVIVFTGTGTTNSRSNINGGSMIDRGFTLRGTDTIAELDARLTAISSTSYTAARLASMTLNDKIYAVRLHDEPSSIK